MEEIHPFAIQSSGTKVILKSPSKTFITGEEDVSFQSNRKSLDDQKELARASISTTTSPNYSSII